MKTNSPKFSFFNKLDIFGFSFNFLIGNSDKYKSHFGATLTIIYILITLALFLGFGTDMYLRKKPTSSYNSEQGDYEKIYLSNDNFTYAFRINDEFFNVISDDRLFRFEANYFELGFKDGNSEVKFYDKISFKRCEEMTNYKEKEKLYNISLLNYNCIDFDNITLGGSPQGEFFYGIRIFVLQCLNSTERQCASQEEFNSKFDKNTNKLFYNDLSLEIKPTTDDYENPLKNNLKLSYEFLSLEMTKLKEHIFQMTYIEDDKGWILPEIENKSFFSTYENTRDFTSKLRWTSDILFVTQLRFSRNFEKYRRSFIKIQNVLASIGGFSNIFFISIKFLFEAFTSANRNIFLINNISFDEEDEKVPNKGKNLSKEIYIYNGNNNIRNPNNDSKISSNYSREKFNNNISSSVSIGQYFKYFIFRKRNLADKRVKNILNNYKLYDNYFQNVLNILNYFNLYNEFENIKKLFLDEDERKGIKVILPNLHSNYNIMLNKLKSDIKINKTSRSSTFS